MKYLSLFTGIGGFEKGIEQAYERHFGNQCADAERGQAEPDEAVRLREREALSEVPRGIGRDGNIDEAQRGILPSDIGRQRPVCIGFSEIDKYAAQIYAKHYPNHTNYGDITKIRAEELPDFDFLVGGFPCQAFSIAGKRKGFDDTRGTLFFDIARILRAKRPRLFLLENVKGLLSHDGGKTFSTIIAALTELGYDLQWQVLNSKNHGVPQNRERVYIVGHLGGTPRPEVFPFGYLGAAADEVRAADGGAGRDSGDGEGEIGRAAERRAVSGSSECRIVQASGDIGNRKMSESDIAYMLRAHANSDGGQHLMENPVGCVKKGEEIRLKDVANTIDASYYKGLDAHQARTGVTDGMRIRRLTPLECERLQGFPDGWTEGVSDTQRYKCLGNAVTVNVIRDIILRIMESEKANIENHEQ